MEIQKGFATLIGKDSGNINNVVFEFHPEQFKKDSQKFIEGVERMASSTNGEEYGLTFFQPLPPEGEEYLIILNFRSSKADEGLMGISFHAGESWDTFTQHLVDKCPDMRGIRSFSVTKV